MQGLLGFAHKPFLQGDGHVASYYAVQYRQRASLLQPRAQQQQDASTTTTPPSAPPNLKATLARSIAEVGKDQWDGCHDGSNPFITFDFLDCLEQSGSVAPDAGWMPQHLVLSDSLTGQVQACVPLYLKSHSYGEYVFDSSWAEAYERAGGRYYPKLQSCVPFTPVTGARLLIRQGPHEAQIRAAAARTLASLPGELGVSSLHCTFCTEQETESFRKAGFVRRIGLQYHWANGDEENGKYNNFDDFLAALQQRKRKAIRQERKRVASEGLVMRRLTGDGVQSPELWDCFYRWYLDTSERKWGVPYLNREFFGLLSERMSNKILLVVAEQSTGGRPVAGALNLIGTDALYGRNWGCDLEDVKGLHFEVCYYQAIEEAIERGFSRVEAGAQGEHKLQRGYLPELTYSAHVLSDQGFTAAVEEFLRRETPEIAGYAEALRLGASPYK